MSLLLAAGATDTTAPTVSAAWQWSASSSAPIIDVVAPVVAASFTWASSPGVPLVEVVERVESIGSYANLAGYDQRAPMRRARFDWRAHAPRPVIERLRVSVTAPIVVARMSWAARSVRPAALMRERPELLLSATAPLLRSKAPNLKRSNDG